MKRIAMIVLGWIVLVVGIVLIPYPGPGWLTVFAGLAILAAEYTWAAKLMEYARDKYDRWNNWIIKQPIFVQSLTVIGTALAVITTLWLLNVYGLIDNLLNLGQHWLRSPIL